MTTRSVDVSDLPAPIARALEVAAEMARRWTKRKTDHKPAPELSVWDGYVIGELRREEIYEDRV